MALVVDSGSYTEDTLKRKRKVAEQLLYGEAPPVTNWAQGLNELAKGYIGGRDLREADAQDTKWDQGKNSAIASLLMGGQAAPKAPTQSNDYSSAISGIESGGKYDVLGPETKGDRAYGKYQIMGNNIPQWSQEALGKQLTPEQFLSDPQAQDAIFKQKFGSYADKYGPEGAAKAWFAGEGGMNNPNAKDALGTSVSDYASKFTNALGSAQPPQQMAQNDPKARIAQMLSDPNPRVREMGQGMASKLLENQLKGSEPTNDIKEFEYSKIHPEFDQRQIELKRAGATNVNNMLPSGEKAYDAEQGKTYSNTFTDMQKAGRDSIAATSNLNKMDELINDPNFYSGSGGEAVTAAKNLAVSLGITDAKDAAPNELFSKIAKKTVLDSAGGSLGTGFSNADRSFLEATVPALSTTKEGNKQIIQLGRKVQQRNQDVAKLAREYAKSNGGRIDAGFDDALAQYAEKNPLFGDSPPVVNNTQPPVNAPVEPQPKVDITSITPKVGEIRKGHKFLGGDPSDQNSWQVIQ